ncbi:endonuclease I family protein [Crocosphaera sp. XPORK-15E]|uniref:endonuclease I family protein n=1 Tax=Crocosphaera sp. XPORK-15E TaxID=3110247 RepID=UPI002B2021C0|nr:endonuclease [Crocosphaera sp. XPORK-15E]MEA5537114.1 endonuclease [Crocosphaera sp. XPORK-15E]
MNQFNESNQSNEPTSHNKNGLEKAVIIADIISKGLVPILVLVVAQLVQIASKNQDVQVELNKLAVEILTTSPENLGEGQKEIRGWAIKVLEKNSNISFAEKAIETLKKEPLNLGKPNTLSYSDARDRLFAEVYNFKPIGIYTGLEITLSEKDDLSPRAEAFQQGMNTEHIWPQSRGATEEARSDLHNLYPETTRANSIRSNKRFDEIPDMKTTTWLRQSEQLSEIPKKDLNEYSESTSDRFEPRESVKGDIARTMFYFHYTYLDQLDDANKEYFDQQKSILCQWHKLDPVDKNEISRNKKIVTIQGNENPFIENPNQADKVYCSQEN